MLRIHLRSTRTDPLFPFTTLLRSPNLNAVAPGWRAALRDVRFRRALSLGIDRAELNQVLYQGTALPGADALLPGRSEEHTSELQSLMRRSYAVFCVKKKKIQNIQADT